MKTAVYELECGDSPPNLGGELRVTTGISQQQRLAVFCRHIQLKHYKETHEKTICDDPFMSFRNRSRRPNYRPGRWVRGPKWAAGHSGSSRAMRAESCGRFGNKHCEKFALF